ncbi:tetratricopeptide repeat protein [Actinocorallia sp. API 0066]|uniref:tetratricopeptide repeat protein n=1 Tax=Actinocorallia sp. API 0066 TaxID=2896846 RepID=UPI0027E09B60|nr:tetratricopeptide repeat protein [Actinocorallia sp. API 0066]
MTGGRGRRGFPGGLWAGDVGGSNIQIGSASGPVTVVVENTDAAYRLDLLSPVPTPRRVPRSQRSPSFLLDTRRMVVPYWERPTIQGELASWCADDEPVSVRLLYGPGGAGKTRLAGRFATLAHDDGWQVLEARDLSAPGQGVATHRADQPQDGDALVVVDYADRWPLESLTRMIAGLVHRHDTRTATDGADAGKLRFLLLARPQQGFWSDVEAAIGALPVDLADPIPLEGLTDRPDALHQAFHQAAHAFQEALDAPPRQVPLPAGLLTPSPGTDPLSPLTVHMAALAAVCAVEADDPVPDSDDLSRYLLQHERRYWLTTEQGPEILATTVMLASLFGPAPDHAQARSWLINARLAPTPTAADQLLSTHARLYPEPAPPAQALPPLKPDHFAEDLVAAHLSSPRPRDLLTDLLTNNHTTPPQARQALTVLAASADRHPTTRTYLFTLLATTPTIPQSWLTPTLIQTVITHAPHDVATLLDNAIPIHRTDLLRPTRDLNHHLLTTLPTTATPAQRAHRLNNLSISLAGTGETRAALNPAREAVQLCRTLAEDDPTTYLPDLAVALNNLSNCLSAVGDRRAALEAAREAVQIRRVQAEAAVYLPNLALSLNNLGNRLSEVGDNRAALEAAREAVGIYRVLAEAEPAVHLPDLAVSLNNLGNRLSGVGEVGAALEAARRAVQIWRALAEAEPAVYLPDVALSLHNLGNWLSEAGEADAALEATREAVQIRRALADEEPATYLPDLARSLNNLSARLSEAGDGDAALEAAREALQIRRALAEADPAHLPGLAMVLAVNAGVRDTYGRDLENALRFADEATAIFGRLAEDLPDVFNQPLTVAQHLRDSLHTKINQPHNAANPPPAHGEEPPPALPPLGW